MPRIVSRRLYTPDQPRPYFGGNRKQSLGRAYCLCQYTQVRYTRTSHHSGTPERRILPILAALGAILKMVLSLQMSTSATRASAASFCGAGVNPIACENSKPGKDPSARNIRGSGDPSIQRFWTDIGAISGSTIGFEINTPAPAHAISGSYQGVVGARKVVSLRRCATPPRVQPQCIIHGATDLR